MPLKPDELAGLAPSLLALGKKLIAMFGADSDGGSELTKDEVKALGRELLSVGTKVLLDVLD